MSKIDKFKGGRHQIGTIKHQERYIDGGKLCYTCETVRKLEDYYTTSTICKFCMNKKAKIRYKKEKQPLWQYMPNKQAKNRKMLRKKRREAIKVWKRKQKQLKKEKRNEKS